MQLYDSRNTLSPNAYRPAGRGPHGSVQTGRFMNQQIQPSEHPHPSARPAHCAPATGQTAEVFHKNYEAMCAILARTGVGRRTNMESWRPTKPACGSIPGVYDAGGLTILAHDGVLGIFERRMADDSVSYLVAHTQRFTAPIESLWAADSSSKMSHGPRKPKSAVRKKLSTKELLDLV